MPAAGGVPRRLTWHPGNDVALGFTPDGKAVLFSSPREVYTTPLHAALHGAGRGRLPDAAADPERQQGRDLARRPDHRLRAARRGVRRSGSTTAAGAPRASCCSMSRRRKSSRCRSRPAAATTPTRCGSATVSTSAPTATASSTSTAFDRATKAVDRLTHARRLPGRSRRAPAPAASPTSRPATSTCSSRPRAVSTRLRLGVAADLSSCGRAGRRAPSGCARRASRPRARARPSSSAARS